MAGVSSSGAAFQIPKIVDVGACSTRTVGHMAKRMARGDSAHSIGSVRYPLHLAVCGGSISMSVILSSLHFKFRKLVMFVAVSQQPVVQS